MYLATGTRPDIAFAIKELSRFLEKPKESAITAAKRAVRYIKGTISRGINYKRPNGSFWRMIETWSDADFGGENSGRKSTFGNIIRISGYSLSCKSSTQALVAQSTAEAEYVALYSLAYEKWYFYAKL